MHPVMGTGLGAFLHLESVTQEDLSCAVSSALLKCGPPLSPPFDRCFLWLLTSVLSCDFLCSAHA